MTYPQQPQYGQPPAPAYGYQPQPSFPQQYAQPTYGQPPTQAPPVQHAPAPAASWTPPQFSEPTGGGEGGAPLKIRELEGRVCGVQPTKFLPATPGKTFNGAPEKDAVVMDILVLDGPVPFQYGESRANDGTAGPAVYAVDALPVLIRGVISSNSEIVVACKKVLDFTPGNTIPCRIVRGTQGNRPYFLAEINGPLDGGTTPEEGARLRGMLGAAYAAVGTGRWPDGSPYVAPVPREINGGPRQKPTTQATSAQPAAQYPPQPAYPPPAPVGQVVYPPAGPTHPVMQAYNAQAPAPQQFAPGSREALLSGQDVPGGWQEQVWRGMTPENRAQFLPPA